MFVSMEITVKEKDGKDITRQNSKTNCKIQRVIIIARMGNENTGYFLEFYMRNFNQNFYQVTAAAYRKPVSHRIFLLHDPFYLQILFSMLSGSCANWIACSLSILPSKYSCTMASSMVIMPSFRLVCITLAS